MKPCLEAPETSQSCCWSYGPPHQKAGGAAAGRGQPSLRPCPPLLKTAPHHSRSTTNPSLLVWGQTKRQSQLPSPKSASLPSPLLLHSSEQVTEELRAAPSVPLRVVGGSTAKPEPAYGGGAELYLLQEGGSLGPWQKAALGRDGPLGGGFSSVMQAGSLSAERPHPASLLSALW